MVGGGTGDGNADADGRHGRLSPIVTVARRMRTSAASRERVASFVWRGSGGRAMGAPFVQVAGRRGLPSFDAAIPPGPGQSTLDAS